MKKFFEKFAFVAIALLGIGLMASTTQAGQNFVSQVAQVLNTGSLSYLKTDNQGALLVGNGASTSLNVAASSVIQTGAGRVGRVSVIVAGAAGALYDSATAASAVAANEIAVIPATQGNIAIDMPFTNGLVYIPGASQVAAISYNK